MKDTSHSDGEYFTWTYDSLKQMTTKPLVEVLCDECRSSWWLLVLSGMVWGSDEMWKRTGRTHLILDDNGNIHNFRVIADNASTTGSSSTATSDNPAIVHAIIHLRISSSFKRILCRVWYVVIRLLIALSMLVIIIYSANRMIFYRGTEYNLQIFFLYLTIFMQAITTLVITGLMTRRVHNFAPLYTINYYPKATPYCFSFFALSIILEIFCLIGDSNPTAFIIAWSNFTLMVCLLFIIVDIQSSSGLVDHLLNKLERYESYYKGKSRCGLQNTSNAESFNPLLSSIGVVPSHFDTHMISIDEYELIRKEVLQRVNESWYVNSAAVTVAALNLLNLAIGAFSYLKLFNTWYCIEVVIQLGKEIVFLFIVFCFCASINAKVDVFFTKLGNYTSWHEKPVYLWLYASLNPISFKLGGYVVTWNSILLQILSIVIGVVFGVLKQTIMNQ